VTSYNLYNTPYRETLIEISLNSFHVAEIVIMGKTESLPIPNIKKKNRRSKQTKKTEKRIIHKLEQRLEKSHTIFDTTKVKTTTTEDGLVLFYSMFQGWSFNFTAFFVHPVYALCFTRWLTWKDMLAHLWFDTDDSPLWHSCVGVAKIESSLIEKVKKETPLWGKVSRSFFKGIDVYRYVGSEKLETTIIRCNNETYNRCSTLFCYHADYQQSAGSIFLKNKKIKDVIPYDNTNYVGDWKITPKNTPGICGDCQGTLLFNIGYSIRKKLKNKANDEGVGKSF